MCLGVSIRSTKLYVDYVFPIPVAVRSKASVRGSLIAGIIVRISLEAWLFVSYVFCLCCVGSGLFDGLITRLEEYYRCMFV